MAATRLGGGNCPTPGAADPLEEVAAAERADVAGDVDHEIDSGVVLPIAVGIGDDKALAGES